jgi:hypothetical protein
MANELAPRALRWVQGIALLGVIVGARFWLIAGYGSPLPIHDQWDAEAAHLFKPWLEGHLGWADLFSPHNEHRIVLARLLALGLLWLNLQWDAQLEMTANAVLCGVIGVAVFAVVRPFFSRQQIPYAAAAIILWLALPYAQENTLWGFQSSFYFLLIFSLAAIWGLSFHRAFSLSWWLGGISALLACFSMASGFLAAIAVLALAGMRSVRERTWAAQQTITAFVAALVLAAAFFLHREFPLHAALKADSPLAWLNVFGRSLAWPFCDNAAAALLMYAPLGWLGMLYCKRRQTHGPEDGPEQRQMELLLAVGLWVVLQAAAIAYGRGGVGTEEIASRYMDILALGALANTGAVAILLGIVPRRRSLIVPGYLWMVAVAVGAGAVSYDQVSSQAGRKAHLRLEVQNVRGYVATGDRRYMEGDPAPPIPYPDPSRLAQLLDDPSIREILPAAVRPALRVEAEVNQDGFILGGLLPTIVNEPNERSWGSYSARGVAARCTMESTSFAPRFPYLQIELAGYLREGMTLDFRSATGDKQVRFSPATRIDTSWRSGFIAVPAAQVRIVARDENSSDWFAFREPREVGRFSYYAERLLAKGAFLCGLGLALLLAAFVLRGQNGSKRADSN